MIQLNRILEGTLTHKDGTEYTFIIMPDDPFLEGVKPFLNDGMDININPHVLNIREMTITNNSDLHGLCEKTEDNNTHSSSSMHFMVRMLMETFSNLELYELNIDDVVVRNIDLLKISDHGKTIEDISLELPYAQTVSFKRIDEEDE